MELASIIEQYQAPLYARYGASLLPVQKQLLNAIIHCRTERYGEMVLRCDDCSEQQRCFHSCGHRSCPRCQNHETTQWLQRQRQKLLPVDYFMVTFTLPYELRSLAWQHPKTVYNALFTCASSTLKDFGHNDKKLGGCMGMTAVLHTHSRRLDYHPHVHVVVPGGCLNRQRRQWQKMKGKYLFNEFALAKVFRGRLLESLTSQGLSIPNKLPDKWVVDCLPVGKGKPALEYLSRYLYRGVICEKNIIAEQDGKVTFKYVDSSSGLAQYRTLKGEDFLWLLLQHVLPKGFRRVRDFGFLHGNGRKMLMLIQWVLRVVIDRKATVSRPPFTCPNCKGAMNIMAFIRPSWRSG